MKKMALFVEGYTEVLFLEHLIQEICGSHNVIIDHKEIRGGGLKSGIKKTYKQMNVTKIITNEKYYFLIYDCGGDKAVAGEIRSQHLNLTKDGYSKIIGIRDVRPDFTYLEIPKLETNLKKYISTKLAPVQFILSIMEIEAWFLAEFKHFPNIDPLLTLEKIKTNIGFDPASDDMQLRPTPQVDLNRCYSLVLKNYVKSDGATVKALDYGHLYIDIQEKIHYLKTLTKCIDEFIA